MRYGRGHPFIWRKATKYLYQKLKMYSIVKLKYNYSSFDKIISARIMKAHYERLYRSYADKLTKAMKTQENQSVPIVELIKTINHYPKKIRDNAGGYFNHTLYFNFLSTESRGIYPKTYHAIKRDFGSFRTFFNTFIDKAKNHFGSGWVWWCKTDTHTLILTTENQDNPLMPEYRSVYGDNITILLGIDLWEHAYYCDYLNERGNYIKSLIPILNYKLIEKKFDD